VSLPQRYATPTLQRPAAQHPHGRPMAPGIRPLAPRPMAVRPVAPHPVARPVSAPPRFLTVAEVASIMRVSKMTVYRLVHGGELAAVRVGRSFRVPEPAVREYLTGARTDVA
jgi:excisionase family DNA binding protein